MLSISVGKASSLGVVEVSWFKFFFNHQGFESKFDLGPYHYHYSQKLPNIQDYVNKNDDNRNEKAIKPQTDRENYVLKPSSKSYN